MTDEQFKQRRRERLEHMRSLGYQQSYQRSVGLREVIKWESESGAAAVFEVLIGVRMLWS